MQHKNTDKLKAKFALFLILSTLWNAGIVPVKAATAGAVVINEVAWAGTADSANDEWIELYNTTDTAFDLSGWTIHDNTAVYALSGTIGAHGYYLVEDREVSVNPNTADAVINVSLTNTGEILVLKDASGVAIDTVNGSSEAWFAGNSTEKATMERVSPLVSGDSVSNWATYSGVGGSAIGALGSVILGTPGALNSASEASGNGSSGEQQTQQDEQTTSSAQVKMELSSSEPAIGDNLIVTVAVSDVVSLFAYGVEINYDSAVITLTNVQDGSFLNEEQAVGTSFQSGLENNVAGKLLVASARTQTVKTGVSGSGVLFTAEFSVTAGEDIASAVSFGANSFMANTSSDIGAQFSGATFTPYMIVADAVSDLQAVQGVEVYTMNLSWSAPVTGADRYKVFRKDAHGIWKQIAEVTQPAFTDSDAIGGGGKIIPDVDYSYRIVAVKRTSESPVAEITGKETRGLKGDNNRSGRVDGRDLQQLAYQFALSDAEAGFDFLVDTTYDGQINGSDLIDLGMNFARSYQS